MATTRMVPLPLKKTRMVPKLKVRPGFTIVWPWSESVEEEI